VDLLRRPGDPIRVHLRLPDPAEAGWASVGPMVCFGSSTGTEVVTTGGRDERL
jgi:hypothetical protein